MVRRAQLLGLSAEYVGPGVKIGGMTWTVSGADAYLRGYFDAYLRGYFDAYLRGYFDGSARAHRSAVEAPRPLARKCPGGCGRTILYGTCKECLAGAIVKVVRW